MAVATETFRVVVAVGQVSLDREDVLLLFLLSWFCRLIFVWFCARLAVSSARQTGSCSVQSGRTRIVAGSENTNRDERTPCDGNAKESSYVRRLLRFVIRMLGALLRRLRPRPVR